MTKNVKRKALAVLIAMGMLATFTLSACNVGDQVQEAAESLAGDVAQMLSGSVTGEVGEQYATQWFDFEVESMTTAQSYGDYTATEGYTLLIARITETNTFGETQPFGTFDWFITADGLDDYVYPLSPLNDEMMPDSFNLEDKETASYDVVIEYPIDLVSPRLTYIEFDETGAAGVTFKIPIV